MNSKKQDAENFVIGLDCSTTSVKAIVFDKTGKIAAQANEHLPLHSPKPNYYEQDPNYWWAAAQNALQKVTNQIDSEKILALAISNQRETFVALDKNGNPLRPAILWLDERCKNEVESFAKKVGHKRLHSITGKPVDYAPVVYRLAWMKKHEPKLYRKIGIICDVQSYIIWKLTGKFKTSWASADPLGLFDLNKKKWSGIILNALGLKENQLPKTYRTGTILSKITEEASYKTGLSINTSIAAGGGDGQCAGLGANVLTSNRAYLNLGTAVVAGAYGKDYKVNKAFRTMCSCSDNGYYYECSLRAGTFAIDWFVKKILNINPQAQPSVYNELEKEAEQLKPGSNGLLHLPYLCGVMNPYWDINAKGAFIGLSTSHTRGHMYRSILEGIAFEQLFTLSEVEKVTSQRINELVVMGGGAINTLWLSILADITNMNICIPGNTEASSLGAAIAAGISIGWYKSFNEAANKMSCIKKIIKPDKQNHKKYGEIYKSYKKLYPMLKMIK